MRLRTLLIALPLALLGLLLFLAVQGRRDLEVGLAATRERPARILSLPLELRPGADLERSGLLEHLRGLGYRQVAGAPRPGEWARDGDRLRIVGRPFRGPDGAPTAGTLELRLRKGRRIDALLDETGRRLAQTWIEPLVLAELHEEPPRAREPTRLEEMPPHLVEAVLVVEDRRFFDHPGVDLRRVLGAAWANLQAGHIVQGGSTITQQLVRSLVLTRERSFARKLREAELAFWLERSRSKQEILEAYLNEVYLGQAGGVGVHGVGAAARHYLGKAVAEVDLSEAALLAGLIQAPSRYDPFERPDLARVRRSRVLDLMHEEGRISETERDAAKAAPLGLRDERPTGRRLAPWFVERLRQDLAARHDAAALARDGLIVLSTLDPGLQRHAEAAVGKGLEALEARHARLREGDAALEAALVALDPRNGEIRALVGGRDWGRSQFDRATQARRQPGSAFKPIVALAALLPDGGGEPAFTLASLLEDEPFQMMAGDEAWEPANHDRAFRGLVTLRHALEQSLNVPFARLGQQLGPGRLVRTAQALGIESPLAAVPSLALGAFEVSLLELVGAYAVLASGGERVAPHSHQFVLGPDGAVQAGMLAPRAMVADPATAFLVTSALQGAVERGTAHGVRRLGVRGVVAGKTGSTNDYRDAWFVGYTPDLVVGVWVGFDDARSVGLSGAAAALPIFADFLRRAGPPAGADDFARPPGLTQVSVDPGTGLRAGPRCPGQPEWFLEHTEPRATCPAPRRGWPDLLFPWRIARRPGDASAAEDDRCRIQVSGLASHDRLPDRFEITYRVTGEAGSAAVAWLAARMPGGRYVSGRGVRVAPGRFRERVSLVLHEPPEKVLALLEVGERRCADHARLPGS